jgi:hypothetical protein
VYAGWEATFDASGSSGDGLSFRIDFGDGTVAKTAVTPHVVLYPGDGSYQRTVRATVTDRFGRVDSKTVTLQLTNILTVTGDTFVSDTYPAPQHRLYFQHQNGTQLTGYYRLDFAQPTTPLTATLSGANHIYIRLDDSTIEMDGIYTFQGPRLAKQQNWLLLSVRGGSADGLAVEFNYYDPY